MLFKSQLMTQASGSLGGITASRNRGGMYFRARTIPTDPATPFQIAVRAIMVNVVARWASVATQQQRDDWALYASLVTLPGPLGDPITVSGFNQFVRTNTARLHSGLPFTFDAPTMFNLGDTGVVTFSAAELGSLLTINFDDSLPWANIDDGALLMHVSRPQNETINFFKGPFRKIDPILGLTAGPPVTPANENSPFTMTAGQRVWLKVQSTLPDGRLSAPQILGPELVV